jgi:hypothetical protein
MMVHLRGYWGCETEIKLGRILGGKLPYFKGVPKTLVL